MTVSIAVYEFENMQRLTLATFGENVRENFNNHFQHLKTLFLTLNVKPTLTRGEHANSTQKKENQDPLAVKLQC